jgi:hypothetical protein
MRLADSECKQEHTLWFDALPVLNGVIVETIKVIGHTSQLRLDDQFN